MLDQLKSHVPEWPTDLRNEAIEVIETRLVDHDEFRRRYVAGMLTEEDYLTIAHEAMAVWANNAWDEVSHLMSDALYNKYNPEKVTDFEAIRGIYQMFDNQGLLG